MFNPTESVNKLFRKTVKRVVLSSWTQTQTFLKNFMFYVFMLVLKVKLTSFLLIFFILCFPKKRKINIVNPLNSLLSV